MEVLEILVPHIRANLPEDTRIGIVGFQAPILNDFNVGIEFWNEQLAESGILDIVDAVTLHDYSLTKDVVVNSGNLDWFDRVLTEEEQVSAMAAFGAMSAEKTQEFFQPGGLLEYKTAWITEYGILQKHYGTTPLLETMRTTGIRGLFVIGRILSAMKYPEVFETLTYFNLGWAHFGESMMINMSLVTFSLCSVGM